MKRFITFSVIVIALCLTVVGVVRESRTDATSDLSGGLCVIATRSNMAKYALRGESIAFSAEDFEKYLNLSEVSTVRITRTPAAEDGCLCIGDVLVSAGQTVSRSDLGLMTYRAGSSAAREASFSFCVGDSGYEMTCELYFLNRENSAPTLEIEDDRALSVSTHQTVSVWGRLLAYDPDGDEVRYEIVRYANGGTIELDASTGEYCYTPKGDYVGEDSFEYVAVDKYGNYSASRRVALNVEKLRGDITLADMSGHRAHHAALTMIELGVMSGIGMGDSTYFLPDRALSRLDFCVMLMHSVGIAPSENTAALGFDDEAEIPEGMRGYVRAALVRGLIEGKVDASGKYLLSPNSEITRAEAALMVSRLISCDTPTVVPTFSDRKDIPAWASDAIYTLTTLGIMRGEGGAITPLSPLTRGQAAQMLLSLREYMGK